MSKSLLCVFGMVLVSVLLAAQVATGRIHGVVRDTSGGSLPGVSVIVTLNGSTVRTVVSAADGAFTIDALAPGRYRLMFALEGFTSVAVEALLQDGEAREVQAVMAVGTLAETLTVTAARPATAQPFLAPSRPSFNTEAYDRIDDNPWSDVSTTPLSTVSIDVDTASYANVRRFLDTGQLPPKDAVRIEELINYFSYEYPAPKAGEPFTVTTASGECPWDSSHRLALIGLQARRLDLAATPPRNLVFLVDVSGSMDEPKKLPLVKAALSMLARNLRAIDRIALVVYAGADGVVLPSTPGDDPGRILNAINSLEAGGPTNGASGIERAYQIARRSFIKGGVNRVILATDGDFNVGVTSEGDLQRLIERQRESGITLSVIGVGEGNLKDATMEMLADHGNGNYSYFDSLGEARKVLVEEVSGTLVTVAKDVKLQVEMNPRFVSRYRLIGYEDRLLADRDFNDDSKDAGDMGAGHAVTALYEIVPAGPDRAKPDVDPLKYQSGRSPSRAAARDELMTLKVRYKEPDADTSRLMTIVVPVKTRWSGALSFASAVAEFGMLLRDSPFKGSASYEHVRWMAEANRYPDRYAHRAEFIEMVGTAQRLRVRVDGQD